MHRAFFVYVYRQILHISRDIMLVQNIKERMSEMQTKIICYPEQVVLVEINGDIDHHTAKQIRADIDKQINDSNPRILILNFSGVTFMDSSGIGLVMGRFRLMSERGGELIVTGAAGYIRKVFQLAGINRLTKMTDDISRYIKSDDETVKREDKEVISDEAKAYQ